MKLIILLSLITSAWGQDNQVSQCGHYEIEGKLVQDKKQFRFLANEQSEAEVRIALGRTIPANSNKDIDRQVKARIEIITQCRYRCRGKLINVINKVPYHRKARMFRPELRLLKKSNCLAK